VSIHAPERAAGKPVQLALIAAAEMLALALWFSASAVVPQLREHWALTPSAAGWLTASVQLGFVTGALASAALNLPDRVPVVRLMALSMAAGAAFNALIAVADVTLSATLALRFATGAALAGVYPPGMKLVATWCREDRGFGIGLLVGALTLGSALPHLVNALPIFGEGGMPPWRPTLLTSSALAAAAALLVALWARPGPFLTAVAPFHWRFALETLRHRPTRLANFGYLGHMWELYAMWAWVPVLLLASYRAAGLDDAHARLAGFAVIGIGAAGCVLAGVLADRFGRTTLTIASLAVSGACALAAGLLFHHPLLLTALCLVWGFAVVADSAQFSAAVSELTDPRYVGSALTLQTSLGFLLTLVTIQLVPALLDYLDWSAVLALLALGPAFGIVSMLALRRLPEALAMASGNR
jgi:MFS family permease